MAGTDQNLFVHLRVHSAYSLLEGALKIERLAELAAADRMPALAITDTNNLFGALEFAEKLSGVGIQPIIGSTIAVSFDEAEDANNERHPFADATAKALHGPDGTIALLAKDEAGYRNLMWLTSQCYLGSGDLAEPHITLADFGDRTDGLIVLTGGPDGPVDRALRNGDEARAFQRLSHLNDLFAGRLYVELQRHGQPEERETEPRLIKMAYQTELPLVASNQAYFAEQSDYDAHDALLCIAEGSYISEDDRRRLTVEHYFKNRTEMVELFRDLPEAIQNAVEIARRCAYRPTVREPILPQFATGRKGKTKTPEDAESALLKRHAEHGLKHRMQNQGTAPGVTEKEYWDRLRFELDVITGMKYAGYFLIVSDFIKWAKAENMPVGPGRGSGAGSVVAWALTITDLDPIRFGLLFERFLNPERVSMPDFDIDFCQDRRDEVIRYVKEKYGADRVAQIITFGKLQARAVMRDVGRVLQMPYGQVDRLCKLVPNNPANPVTLSAAIEGEPRLQEARDNEPIVAQMLEIAQKLEGLYRHASTHAAGVVIGDRPLSELVPIYRDPRAELPATQFNMKWVELAGLVKFDFLGLKTLTVIAKAQELIRETGSELDFENLPLDDPKAYALMARGDTVGVFQLEGSGMRESLRKLKPDRFEDIIAMVALYRPGPMDNIETYINRKYGREEPDYLHPLIRSVLEETHGVIIYQEQVMQVAQLLSGYSLGEADLLRRAMGKKIKSEMDQQKKRFVDGAVANGVEKARAVYIFELVAKFAGYGFNKSHAAAYALIAYQTAYLKANYPVAFLAATMTLDMGNTDKLNLFCQEAKRSGIAIEPPCVSASKTEFMPSVNTIRYSLAALKNIGTQAVEHICTVRDAGGPFDDLADFARRIDPGMVNRRAVETLAAAGAFDTLESDRAKVFHNVDRIMGEANRSAGDRALGQSNLFAGDGAASVLELSAADPWTPIEQLAREAEAVGFYLSGHPLDSYEAALAKLSVETWSDFVQKVRQSPATGRLAGTVTYRQERRSKSGNQFAFAGFSDRTGEFEAVVFSETLAASRDVLEPGKAVLLTVEGECDSDVTKTRILTVEALDKAATRLQKGLRIYIAREAQFAEIARRMPGQGTGEIQILLQLDQPNCEIEVVLPGKFDVSPRTASLLKTLTDVVDVEEIWTDRQPIA
ncbi:MAG: DNA polymerase III subunit alpha [Methyloligellaceae bacterium]